MLVLKKQPGKDIDHNYIQVTQHKGTIYFIIIYYTLIMLTDLKLIWVLIQCLKSMLHASITFIKIFDIDLIKIESNRVYTLERLFCQSLD